MAFRPVDIDVPAAHAGGRRYERDRSFTVEQFETLVSSALDMQGIPDSALSFSFGGKTYPPSWRSARPEDDPKARRRKTGTFSRLRGAFSRKLDAPNAPPIVPPETRRLASSSVPVLSLPRFQSVDSVPNSTSVVSLDFDRAYYNSCSTPATPALPSFPLISHQFASYNGSINHAYTRSSPSLDISPSERNYSSTRSFLNLKPLTIPKLSKKSSEGSVPPGFLPTPPELPRPLPIISSAPNDGSDLAENEGLSSFFDDSGFEEGLRASNMTKKKSKASFRSLFSSAISESQHASGPSVVKHDKALPPTPVMNDLFVARPCLSKPDARDSLFYSPPFPQQEMQRPSFERDAKTKTDKEPGTNRVTNWIARSASSTPRRAKRIVRSSPPAYPSPTSPLPPTPNFLPAAPRPDSVHIHVLDCIGDMSEGSIDSTEISSWRMPSLEQQVSKTSTTSSAHAHTLGRPSRGSIRERLGLGPRLQVHVPLPAQFLSDSTRRSKSQDGRSSESTVRDRNALCQNSSCSSGTPTTPRLPLPRLASASLISLRSIATITAGSKGPCDENEDNERKDALDIDRAFTPEEDPFAPDPLTPITPTNPVFQPQTGKEKYRSFIPLGNNSSTSLGRPETPISAPASLPSWHYRLGSHSNMSSPALTPTSSLRRVIPVPTNAKATTNLSNARSKLQPTSVEALNVRDRTPSVPLSPPSNPPSNRRNLSRVISRVRRIQNNYQNNRYLASKSNDGDRDPSGIAGHTESRPHSPFPMLFLRPGIAKSVPAVTRDSRRSSVTSIVHNVTDEGPMQSPLVSPPASPAKGSFLSWRIKGQVLEPKAPSAKDADAFVDAVTNYRPKVPKRDIVSPTAWLLDSDDYDDDGKDGRDFNVVANKANVLDLDLNFRDQTSEQRGVHQGNGIEMSSAVLSSSQPTGIQCDSFTRDLCETESETETEGDIILLDASPSWPLPPHRTVVVDEESGEGYHVVEPVLEFVPVSSASHSPRHSIRFPKRQSGTTSIASNLSGRSDSSSLISQKLNKSQTRLIAEQFGHSQNVDKSFMDRSPDSLQAIKTLPVRPLKQRSRSATSLASVGALSLRTSRTAFYSARSTASRGSDRSTFSYTHSRQIGKLSRKGSSHSASSSRSPPSSAGHHGKIATAPLELNTDSRVGSAVGAKPFASVAQRAKSRHEVIAIPERIVLHSTARVEAFYIIVSGWARLLTICERYGSVSIEASEGENWCQILSVLVEDVYGSSSEPIPDASEAFCGIGNSEPRLEADPFVKLSLSLQRSNSITNRPSHVAFCLPLPATLGNVVDVLKQTRSFQSAT